LSAFKDPAILRSVRAVFGIFDPRYERDENPDGWCAFDSPSSYHRAHGTPMLSPVNLSDMGGKPGTERGYGLRLTLDD
jgi:hypothetical protein